MFEKSWLLIFFIANAAAHIPSQKSLRKNVLFSWALVSPNVLVQKGNELIKKEKGSEVGALKS